MGIINVHGVLFSPFSKLQILLGNESSLIPLKVGGPLLKVIGSHLQHISLIDTNRFSSGASCGKWVPALGLDSRQIFIT